MITMPNKWVENAWHSAPMFGDKYLVCRDPEKQFPSVGLVNFLEESLERIGLDPVGKRLIVEPVLTESGDKQTIAYFAG